MSNINQPSNDIKGIIRTMTIIHYAFCASILIFGLIICYSIERVSINFADTEDLFFYLVPFLAIMGAVVGRFLFQNNLKNIHEKPTLKEKLGSYQSAILIRTAMIEGPGFLGIVAFMITGNQLFLIISAVLLVYLFLLRPTTSTIIEDLNLKTEEEREFRKAMT